MKDLSPATGGHLETAHKSFDCMGTRIGFWIDAAAGARANTAIAAGERLLRDFDDRLSRFRDGSELCRLNADPREEVEVSPQLARLVAAACDAARRSGGLVDPTLLTAIEDAGYRRSRAGATSAPLAEALAAGPPAARAHPHPAARWREIEVNASARTVRRPPGVRIDSGGCGKGLAADMVAGIWCRLLPRHTRFVVDCGGDIRVGALPAGAAAYEIDVELGHAGAGELTLSLTSGAVATSGIGNRLWRNDDGGFAHHLLDPATGRPAWTGLTAVTAVGATALDAETTAKTALLLGPDGARRTLTASGGAMVGYDGTLEVIQPSPAAAPAADASEPANTNQRAREAA